MSKMFAQKLKNPFVLTIILYLVLIFFVKPFGNFPVNDDWIFARQVEHFLHGGTSLSALVDPSFIAQGALGVFWSLIFGFSFVSLRILTILMGIFLLFGVYKILQMLRLGETAQLTVLLLVAFNPVIFSSVPTFMTEIYFLAFFVWSLYFYQIALKGNVVKPAVLGSLCCSITILIRQIGIVIYVAFLLAHILRYKKRSIATLLLSAIPVAVSFFVFSLWPSYDSASGVGFVEAKFFYPRLNEFVWIVPYISYFLLPLLLVRFGGLKRNTKIVVLFLAIPLAWVLFERDIFSVGSVFYIEKLHAKTGFRSNLSLFDNVPFKLLLGYLVSLGILSFLYSVVWEFRKFREHSFLVLVSLGMLAPLFVSNDLYDRYLLPVFIALLLLFAGYVKKTVPTVAKVTLALLVFVTFMLTYEYFTIQSLKWEQAWALQEVTGLRTGIFLDGTYVKYTRAKDKGDYTGLIKTMPDGLNYKCFVQEYTLDADSFVSHGTKGFEKWLDRYVENPVVYDRKKLNEIPSIKKHLEELLYNQEYISPIYNVVGKRAFVGSYCLEE